MGVTRYYHRLCERANTRQQQSGVISEPGIIKSPPFLFHSKTLRWAFSYGQCHNESGGKQRVTATPRAPHNSWPEMRAPSRAVVNRLLRRSGEISFIEIKTAAKFCHYGNAIRFLRHYTVDICISNRLLRIHSKSEVVNNYLKCKIFFFF